MFFQGTVLGPLLWNVYYYAVTSTSFIETVFADDLNCFRIFDASHSDDHIFDHLAKCQARLHEWGKANQIAFEASKESVHIRNSRLHQANGGELQDVKRHIRLSFEYV